MEPKLIPLPHSQDIPVHEMIKRSREFYEVIRKRRSVRHFSERPVPLQVIENCLRAAGTAPSGANLQPWHFVVVTDPEVKKQIRDAAEEEELEFYTKRAPQAWLDMLASLGTDHRKPFLEKAPVLIAVFVEAYGWQPGGQKIKHYYAHESVGLATGFLITSLHIAGLATLTHTPSPMGFLNDILGRPPNERPFLILVSGFPAEDAQVPVISKKSYTKIVTIM